MHLKIMNKRRCDKTIFHSMKNKGVSPVIATVLLVSMVVVTGLIIFVWFKGMTQEAITKDLGTGDKNIELVCDDVRFDASYSSGTLFISNGDTPIFGMDLKIFEERSHRNIKIRDLSGANWPETGLGQAGTFSGSLGNELDSATKVILVPILIGNTKAGEKTHTCDGDRHGYEIIV